MAGKLRTESWEWRVRDLNNNDNVQRNSSDQTHTVTTLTSHHQCRSLVLGEVPEVGQIRGQWVVIRFGVIKVDAFKFKL